MAVPRSRPSARHHSFLSPRRRPGGGRDRRSPILEERFGATREGLRTWKAVGCDACSGSGYEGRIALHEPLVTDDEIKASIARKSPVDRIRSTAMAGGTTTLLQDGVAKAIAGSIDTKQVLAAWSK